MDLLKNFTLEQILVFAVLLALAIKGVVSFYDWIKERNHKAAKIANQPVKLQNNVQKHDEQIKDLKDSIQLLANKVDLLINSDKDAIKAFITKEHHYFCYQKGFIDDYSLDCIEKRYSHYKEQGGNSFIKTLIEEMRALPRQEK